MPTAAPGRRERKKAATRQALADAALELFLARGFDAVTVAEIAEVADVSVTTLFKHFPSKEALVFDEDAAQEQDLVVAVRDRAPGTGVLDALHAFLSARIDWTGTHAGADVDLRRFHELIDSTQSVREYGRRMWARHEDALAAAIAADRGEETPSARTRALAHVVVETPALVRRGAVDAREQLDAVFALLRDGWSD